MRLFKNGFNEQEIIAKLKEVQLFRKYADNEPVLHKIADMCSHKKFKQGAYIIREGSFGDELYIIFRGEIDIVKKTLQNEKYTVTTLGAEMGGIYVGEMALIDNDRRSASVLAKTHCECLVIKRGKFVEFGDENPEIGLNITRAIACQICSRLRQTGADVITLFSALVDEIADKS